MKCGDATGSSDLHMFFFYLDDRYYTFLRYGMANCR